MASPSYFVAEGKHTNLCLKYYFISNGNSTVVKAIDYSYTDSYNGKKNYNLAFGDYDTNTDEIRDDVNTENGDVYKVFNTILTTIPTFFRSFSDAMIFVQGSDSSKDFIDKCRLDCTRTCDDCCKKSNRRINVYTGYINKNYYSLQNDFTFYGGVKDVKDEIIMEDYVCCKKYNAVFVVKKNV